VVKQRDAVVSALGAVLRDLVLPIGPLGVGPLALDQLRDVIEAGALAHAAGDALEHELAVEAFSARGGGLG
jgi:hypothetical protein